MTDVLGDFIRALRANDVRISTAESIDAGAALALIGYDDRALLRHALSQALAKSEDQKRAFGETFERFFAFDHFRERETPPGTPDPPAGQDPDTAPALPGGGAGASLPGGGEGTLDLASLIESGDRARLQMALAEAARQVRLNRIRFFTQRGLYVRRIMEAMGLEALERRADTAARGGDEARAGALRAMREALRLEVRDLVESQLKLFTANAGPKLREEVLSQIRLTNVDHADMKAMRELIGKMARRLVSLHRRRKKMARRGQLDVRRTIRANIEYDGVPFRTIWKRTKIDRPKVMAICDVSGSVARVSRFLLMFLYSLHDVLPQVRSFAFSDRLGEVTPLFEQEDVEDALAQTLKAHGGGSTDYDRALADFETLAIDDVDHRTTVLVLGDARSNYGSPRSDILRLVRDRARRVIFLNPEPRTLWGTGDSEMRRLAPHCDAALVCASLKDLERVVSDLLRTAV